MRKPFNWKFALATALLFSLPFGLISLRFYRLNERQARQDSQNVLSMHARMTAALVRQSLETDYGIPDLISTPAFEAANWKNRAEQLAKLRAANPEVYIKMVLVDATGREAGSIPAVKNAPQLDYSRAPHFIKTMRTGMSYGVVEQQKSMPPLLAVSEPVVGRAGKIEGIVITTISLEKLANIIASSRASYEEGESALMDSGGMLIADSRGIAAKTPGTLLPRELLLLWRTYANAVLGFAGGDARVDGKDIIAGFARVNGTDWTVCETEPASIINSQAAELKARLAVLSGLTLVWFFALLTERLAAFMLK
jgi:hypothetical protein